MVEVAVAERINEGSREADIGPFICRVVRALVRRPVGITHWVSTVIDLGDVAVKTAADADSASVECHGDGETHLGAFRAVTWHSKRCWMEFCSRSGAGAVRTREGCAEVSCGGVVGTQIHLQVVRAVTWHVEAAVDVSGCRTSWGQAGLTWDPFSFVPSCSLHDWARVGHRCCPSR